MTQHQCQKCGRKGRLGNQIRTYVATSPLAAFNIVLCWRCYLKQEKKNKKRPHFTIQDKIHAL